jgi:hypothetical protein
LLAYLCGCNDVDFLPIFHYNHKDRQAKKQQHYNHKDRQEINIITTTKIGKQKNNNNTTTKIGKKTTSLQPQR